MPKRMLDPKIVDTDLFLSMPVSARLLYYDLNVRADDDGFVDSPKKIMSLVKASEDDLRILITRGFVITFETGVCVIRHWRIHNYIRPDRYHPTLYQSELKSLEVCDKIYQKKDDIPVVGQLSYQMDTEIRLDSSNSSNIVQQSEKDENGRTIYEVVEIEFGRPLSPMEFEVIASWNYPIGILKLAIKEAVTSANFSIKYIDRIIFNWQKANIRTVEEAKEYIRRFRENKQKKKVDQPESSRNSGTDYYQEL